MNDEEDVIGALYYPFAVETIEQRRDFVYECFNQIRTYLMPLVKTPGSYYVTVTIGERNAPKKRNLTKGDSVKHQRTIKPWETSKASNSDCA